MRRLPNSLLVWLTAIVLVLPIGVGALAGILESNRVADLEQPQAENESYGLALSENEVAFNTGSARTLSASVSGETGSFIYQWNTSDKSVVSVKKDAEAQNSCQLTAVGAGSATVTVSIIDIAKFKVVESVTCTVDVSDEQIDFGVDEVIISLDKGNSAEVTAAAPDGGEIVWFSEDERIVTVEDGVITAHQAGQTWVVARSGNVESKLPVRIYNSYFTLEEVKLICVGESAKIAVDGSIHGNAEWSCGDDRVASVDADGVVTGVKPGMTTVAVSSDADGLSSVCVIIVKSGDEAPVELAVGKKSAVAQDPGAWFYLCESDMVTVSAVPTYDNGVICMDIMEIGDSGANYFYLRCQPDDVGDVIYRNALYIYSSEANVPIQINGSDYQLKKGMNRIETEFTSSELDDGSPYQIKWKGTGRFYVIPEFEEISHIEKIMLSDKNVTLNTTTNTSLVLNATVTDQLAPVISWISSNEKVATVSDGVVTAVGEGTAMISAVCGDLTANCLVTVEGETPITGDKLSSGNKTATLASPGQWFYLRDGKSAFYTDPILDSNGNVRLAIKRIDTANRKYVYLRYQPEELKTYKAVITIEFAGADGTSIDVLGGNVAATPVTLHNGINTVELTFTADNEHPFQFKFYTEGSYVIHVAFQEE